MVAEGSKQSFAATANSHSEGREVDARCETARRTNWAESGLSPHRLRMSEFRYMGRSSWPMPVRR